MELKIPPPLLALMVAVFMWGVSRTGGPATLAFDVAGILSLIVLIVGLAISVSAMVSFRNASTTVNPRKPESATHLVNSGIYRLSRNPMYLGVLLVLSSWAIWLGNVFNLATLLFFVWYITKFQIVPEEKALEALFPKEFGLYKSRVRQWI